MRKKCKVENDIGETEKSTLLKQGCKMKGRSQEKKSLSRVGSRSNIADKATSKHQGLGQDQIGVPSKL